MKNKKSKQPDNNEELNSLEKNGIHNIDEAIHQFKASDELFQAMGDSNDQKVLESQAINSYNLGLCYGIKKDIYFCRKYTRNAIILFNKLSNKKNNTKAILAHSHGTLAESYEEEDFENAIFNWTKSCNLFEELSQENQSFLPYLAAAYNNIAVNQKRNFEHNKAAQNYMKSLEHYIRLYNIDSLEFKPFLAASYNSLGILFSEMFDRQEGYNYYEKANQLYAELSNDFPDLFLPYLGTIRHNIGIYFDDLHQYDKAIEYYQDALNIRNKLAKDGPQSFLIDKAITALNMITIYQAVLDKEGDINVVEKATDLIFNTKKTIEKIQLSHPVLDGIKGDLVYFTEYFQNALKNANNIQEHVN